MFTASLALALSWQALAPRLVTPGADIAQVVRLLGEYPRGECYPDPREGWPDNKRYHFEQNHLSVVVDWKGKVVSVRRD